MIPVAWSVLLAATGLLGTALITFKKKSGWVVFILGEVLWIVYGVATAQWGFLGSGMAYLMLNVFALVRWHREDKERTATFQRPR